jgi:hypothetical protein
LVKLAVFAEANEHSHFGVGAAHLLNQNIARLLPQASYQECFSAREVQSLSSPVAFHLPTKEPNNSARRLEMTLSTCGKQGKRLYTAIIRDITEITRSAVLSPVTQVSPGLVRPG